MLFLTDYCDSYLNPSTLEYDVTKEGVNQCSMLCTKRNQNHVQSLNLSILLLIEHLFDATNYRLQLIAIDENISECIKRNNKFICECKFNYNILVNYELMNLWNSVMHNKKLRNNRNETMKLTNQKKNIPLHLLVY